MQNPKVATREIERALWDGYAPGQAPANPHGLEDSPFWKPAQLIANVADLKDCEWFTVARNPFARFVSAYVDKVQRPPWARIASTFGLSSDDRPAPRELLHIMTDTAPEQLDHHFRPQHLNVLHGTAPLAFVGHLESMHTTAEWLSERGAHIADAPRRYATNADARVGELLDSAARTSITEFYGEDFARFGYTSDWRALSPVGPASLGGGTIETMREALR